MGFDPVTVFAVSTLASGALSAGSSIMAGRAQASADAERAAVADRNAETAELNASRALQRTRVEAQDQDFLTLAALGQQEAVQAASGLGGRSQMRARATARELGRRDALNVIQAGQVEAFNFRVEAENQRAEGRVARSRGKSSLLSGFLDASSSLIGSAASIASTKVPRFETRGRDFGPRPS